jgi:RNA polymerase sigma-70 factor (ECF subfamily)
METPNRAGDRARAEATASSPDSSLAAFHLPTPLLVHEAAEGKAGAREELFKEAYGDLLHQARRLMRHQRSGHTLEPESLVHEAYLRVARADPSAWNGYGHFLALMHRAMRQSLIDHGLRKGRSKRGGGRARERLSGILFAYEDRFADIADLHAALERLRDLDPGAASVVDLKFFGGLEGKDVAHRLGVSLRTVERDWQFARTWLLAALTP